MAFEDLGDRYNSGFGREIDDTINRNQGGDGGRRRRPQTPPPLDEPPVVVQKPFSRLAQKIIDGNPQNTTYELGQNTTFLNPDGNIQVRKVDLNNLGTAGQLGTGDYVLESLYLNTHKNNPNRQPINTGRLDENGNPILIPTVRAGMGNLDGLDIKGYSSNEIFYRGSDRGDEPYQIASIGSEPNDPVPNGTSRLLTFYNSDAGRNLVVRDNLLQFIHNNPPKLSLKKARKLTFARVGDILEAAGIGLLAARFQPGHNALLSNLILKRATLDIKDRRLFEIGGQSVNLNQVLGALGTSVGNIFGGVRNRFSVGYSARTRTGQPFGNLGDKPWNLSFLQRVKKVSINEERDGKLRTYLRKQQNKINKAGVKESERIGNQTTRKITPFMDLTGKGNHDEFYKVGPVEVRAHGYDDKISNSGVEEAIKTTPPLETTKAIEDGDFYVRFKDLRDNDFIYFRGYINGITENLSPSWNSIDYVGRSEPVYMYQRAERDISFNLAVYPQNNKEEEFMYIKMNRLTSLVYPEYMDDGNRLTRMKPPFTEMYMAHIGSKAKGQFGYIKSLSYTVNESGDWNALQNLPRVFNIAISYQIIGKRPPSIDSKFYQSVEAS
tara:strand:+ start:2546 stop:4369 length:1824 start_codon:yes stop_codon:yes gene_type:complete